MRLIQKSRVGGQLKRKYDEAKAPYQRILKSRSIDREKKQALAQLYLTLNPVKLKREIEQHLKLLRKLIQEQKKRMQPARVTFYMAQRVPLKLQMTGHGLPLSSKLMFENARRRIFTVPLNQKAVSKLARFLRKRRLDLGLTQKQLALRAGWREASGISQLEMGWRAYLSEGAIRKLGKGLHCSYRKLKKLVPCLPLKKAKSELGRLVRRLREQAGLTQTQCAAKARISAKHFNELERGRRRKSISKRTALRLAKALRCDASILQKFVSPSRRERTATTDFGAFLRTRRHELNLSQADLAKKVGKTKAWVSALELGKPEAAAGGNLHLLARALRLKVSDFAIRALERKRQGRIPKSKQPAISA